MSMYTTKLQILIAHYCGCITLEKFSYDIKNDVHTTLGFSSTRNSSYSKILCKCSIGKKISIFIYFIYTCFDWNLCSWKSSFDCDEILLKESTVSHPNSSSGGATSISSFQVTSHIFTELGPIYLNAVSIKLDFNDLECSNTSSSCDAMREDNWTGGM